MNLVTRLGGIKKQFTKIAFIGPNPDLFLLHIPKSNSVDKFYFVEQTEQQVQTSYDTITKKIENGFYEKKGCSLPTEIIPVILRNNNLVATSMYFKLKTKKAAEELLSYYYKNNHE